MPKGPEYQRQQRITRALRQYGWLHTHFRPLRTEAGYRTPLSGDKGYPDITAVHPDRGILLFIEVKANRGMYSDDQKMWLGALGHIACDDVQVWGVGSDEAEADLLSFISGGAMST